MILNQKFSTNFFHGIYLFSLINFLIYFAEFPQIFYKFYQETRWESHLKTDNIARPSKALLNF